MNMDDVKAMIKAATQADATEFQNAFATVMNDKVTAALAGKYDSMFGTAEEVVDEPEQVDDISAEEEGQND